VVFQRNDCGSDIVVSAEETDSWPFATASLKSVRRAGPSLNKGVDANNKKSTYKGR
jgi:hypothetical protein